MTSDGELKERSHGKGALRRVLPVTAYERCTRPRDHPYEGSHFSAPRQLVAAFYFSLPILVDFAVKFCHNGGKSPLARYVHSEILKETL